MQDHRSGSGGTLSTTGNVTIGGSLFLPNIGTKVQIWELESSTINNSGDIVNFGNLVSGKNTSLGINAGFDSTTTIGADAADKLIVNATSTFNAPANFVDLSAATGNITNLTAVNGSITKLTALTATVGTLGVSGDATVGGNLSVSGTTTTTSIVNSGNIATDTLTADHITTSGLTVVRGPPINLGDNLVHGVATPILGSDAANKS